MRDYKKIYDELDCLDFTDEFDKIKKSLPFDTNSKEYISELLNKHSLDKKRTQQFHNFLKQLEEDKPTQEVINIFNYIFSNINTTREWQPINCMGDGYWEDVFESYKTPDNQIEAVCKKYAYLEWWIKIVDFIPYHTDDIIKLIMILRLPSDFETFVKNTIQLFDYYHKTIIPRKVLSEIKETPNKETSKNNVHFNPSLNEKSAIAIFNELVENNFLKSDSKLSLWFVACGYVNSVSHDYLDWIGEVQSLAYMIDKYIGKNDSNKWEITKGLFTIKGKEPNIGSMKNICSGVKNDERDRPQIFDTIDDIFTRNKIK